MATWSAFSTQAPELAAAVRSRMLAHRHLTMATLRLDGSPRISGTELVFVADDAPLPGGDVLPAGLYVGGMTGNRRFTDLRRDPRVSLHSGSDSPENWQGDAKISGRAVEILTDAEFAAFRRAAGPTPEERFEVFRIDPSLASLVRLAESGDHLSVETWRAGRGVTSVRR